MYQDHQGLPRQFYKEQCSIDAIITNLDWTVYINSDMSFPTRAAGKHMPTTFSYSPAT